MFFHETDDFLVVANLRCGHTSMASAFGIEPHKFMEANPDNWIYRLKYSKARIKVVVVRNPWDRLQSAMNFSTDRTVISEHSVPYLSKLNGLESEKRTLGGQGQLCFRFEDYFIINFHKLSEYIPIDDKSVVTNAESSEKDLDRMFEFWSPEELYDEDKSYLEIMRRQPEISVSVFKNFYK